MTNVIDLFPGLPQQTGQGEVFCLQCGAEWQCAVPVGTTRLECPACHAMKGLLRFEYAPSSKVWECDCGNQLFYITPEGHFCPNCGIFNCY